MYYADPLGDMIRHRDEPDKFFSKAFNKPSIYMRRTIVSRMMDFESYKNHPACRKLINRYFVDYTAESIVKVDYNLSMYDVRAYTLSVPLMTDETKKGAVDKLFERREGGIYNDTRHYIESEYIEVYKNSPENLVNLFNKANLSPENARAVVNILYDTDHYSSIQNKIQRSKKIKSLGFVAENMKDDKCRMKLLKNLATTPTSFDYLRFRPSFSFEDIKSLAPVMRFKLIKSIYERETSCPIHVIDAYMKYHFGMPELVKYYEGYKPKVKAQNAGFPHMSIEQVSELLMPVAIRKHAEVNEFLERLKKYSEIMNGKESYGD